MTGTLVGAGLGGRSSHRTAADNAIPKEQRQKETKQGYEKWLAERRKRLRGGERRLL